jgi:WD40 repeat protein
MSTDAQRIAAASDKGYTHIWDANGQKLLSLSGISHPKRWLFLDSQLVFSRNAQRLMQTAAFMNTSAMHEGSLIVWDASGKELLALRNHPASFVADLHPDGDQLAAIVVSGRVDNGTSGGDKRELRIWSISKRRNDLSVPLPKSGFSVLALSPNGKELVTFLSDTLAPSILDTRTGQTLRELELPGDGTYPWPQGLAFSPSGKLVIANFMSFLGSELVLWDTDTGKLRLSTQATIGGHVGRIAWSRDEERLALTIHGARSREGQVLLWDLTTNQQLLSLNIPENVGGGEALAFGSEDDRLYSVGGKSDSKFSLLMWDAPSQTTVP